MTNAKAPKTVLVADDQEFVRTLVMRMLQQLSYEPRPAKDGDEAMLALKFVDGALILDQQMEGKTGLEVLKAVRSGKTSLDRDFPVLIITGNADVDVVQYASALDVSGLLGKPVSKAQLGERLAVAMQRKIKLRSPEEYDVINVVKKPEPDYEIMPAPAPPPAEDKKATVKTEAPVEDEEEKTANARTLKRKDESKSPSGKNGSPRKVRTNIHYKDAEPGMTVAENLVSSHGKLLLGAGTTLDENLIARLAVKCETEPALRFLPVFMADRSEKPC